MNIKYILISALVSVLVAQVRNKSIFGDMDVDL